MPVIQSQGCPINVEVEGAADAPVLMMSNSLGTNLHMWDLQAPSFTKHFRLVRYDRRGHGKSGVPKGPYSMEMLGCDALAVMDGLGLAKVSWCGLSMGGMVGQWLGANAPERIDRLILSNTHSFYPDKALWDERIKNARDKGLAAAVEPTMERWFSKEFRERARRYRAHARDVPPDTGRRLRRLLRGDPQHGSARHPRAHQRADPRDRRPPRPRNAAGSRQGDPGTRQGRQARRARRRAHLQRRAAAGLYRHGPRFPKSVAILVIAGLDPAMHLLAKMMDARAWASKAMPFCERLCPRTTEGGIH